MFISVSLEFGEAYKRCDPYMIIDRLSLALAYITTAQAYITIRFRISSLVKDEYWLVSTEEKFNEFVLSYKTSDLL